MASRGARRQLLICAAAGLSLWGLMWLSDTQQEPASTTTVGQGLASRFEARYVDLSSDGETCRLCLLIADNPELRSQGLSGLAELGGYDGMLFSYDAPVMEEFWMFRTMIPLRIMFFADTRDLVSQAEMAPCPDGMPPSTCTRYQADAPYRWAVEVQTERQLPIDIGEGTQINWTGLPCQPDRTPATAPDAG